MRLSLDTETTGVDLRHGAKPFIVTTCNEDGINKWWTWEVDPETRQPIVDQADVEEILTVISDADELILQNPKFDYEALATIAPKLRDVWDWDKVRDTLLAGHLLASNQPHDLTTMAMVYLGVNIQPFEDAVVAASKEARRLVQSKDFVERHGEWAIARKGRSDMPSAKDSVSKYDMWLPAAAARAEGYPEDHPWFTVAEEYANADSAVTLPLYDAQLAKIRERNLEAIYQTRLKVLPIVVAMERAGVTISERRLEDLESEYGNEARTAECRCVALSNGRLEKLPVSGASNALRAVLFDDFKLETNKKTKKGNDSLDKTVLEWWEGTLSKSSKAGVFVRNLRAFRKRSTALSYMEGYRRFWLDTAEEGYKILHPSLNPTGTDTLRWSSSNPNEQNISKQEGFNLRHCFGPLPGRVWFSMDARGIEDRLPAYESGERDLIEIFERPNDPPYYGSNHLLRFHTVYPDIWEKELREVGEENVGPHCKKKYASTYYQWCKNGGFAVQYGAIDREDGTGTADLAFHKAGAHALLKKRFAKLEWLNQYWIRFAERHGYVETMPDMTVDPERGYPLLCSRSNWGRIMPTVPLNYHIQGTAMWWMMKAMIRCYEFLRRYNLGKPESKRGRIVLQVHDELVFDFPADVPLSVVRTLRNLMQKGGDDLGIPTPVSIERHDVSWAEGESV